MRRLLPPLMLVVILFAPSLTADIAPALGDNAPNMGKTDWVINQPDVSDMKEMRGDVVVIVNC